MIEESAAVLPMWMLLSAAFGFMIGEVLGQNFRYRKCLEEANEDLREELEKARACEAPLHHELKRQRGVLQDIHKQITVAARALQRPAN